MAKLIILEGLSRTGKSTIAKSLSEKYGFRLISIKDKMPEGINLSAFYQGMHVYGNAIFEAFPEETFILDRAFLSELAYSSFFKRKTCINPDTIHDMLSNPTILIHLDNTYDKYLERSPKDRIKYTKEDFDEQRRLFDLYFDLNENIFSQNIFVKLDSSTNSLEELTQQIENILNKF